LPAWVKDVALLFATQCVVVVVGVVVVMLLLLLLLCREAAEPCGCDVAKQLMNADLHAALLHVTQSCCSSLVGISGIVLQETRNTFVLVTPHNQLKS